GKLLVRVETPVRVTFPRAEVHLVDAHRSTQPVPARTPVHPGLIAPLIGCCHRHSRRGTGPPLELASIRVGLDQDLAAVSIADLVFVQLATAQTRDEQLPHPARPVDAHRMYTPIPSIEIANHANALGIRRPYAKADTIHAVALFQMGSERAPRLSQPTLIEEVQIVAAQRRDEPIRIVEVTDTSPFAHTQDIRGS